MLFPFLIFNSVNLLSLRATSSKAVFLDKSIASNSFSSAIKVIIFKFSLRFNTVILFSEIFKNSKSVKLVTSKAVILFNSHLTSFSFIFLERSIVVSWFSPRDKFVNSMFWETSIVVSWFSSIPNVFNFVFLVISMLVS